jgi:hypothetical protein
MNCPLRLLVVLLLTAVSVRAESLPFMRPALLGHHSRSLVNLIDTAALAKRGQGDAVVLFSCVVNTIGDAYAVQLYRATPNSNLLKEELKGRFNQAQFEPAVYRHAHQTVYLSGTVMFKVIDGKPRLVVFLHQDEDAMKRGVDFIAPQMMFTLAGTKFKGIYWPPGAPGHEGTANLRVAVNEQGKVTAVKTIYEYPAAMGFGAAAAGPTKDADFIPGYRNGKPVACDFEFPVLFSGPGVQMKSG